MATNEVDLSSDSREPANSGGISPNGGDTFKAQAELYHQRYQQRQSLFWLALTAAAVMTIAFLVFVYSVTHWALEHPGEAIDWHIMLMGSSLIVPPTLIAWNLMKQVFRSDGKLENGRADDGGGILVSDVIKEVLSLAKEWVSKK